MIIDAEVILIPDDDDGIDGSEAVLVTFSGNRWVILGERALKEAAILDEKGCFDV